MNLPDCLQQALSFWSVFFHLLYSCQFLFLQLLAADPSLKRFKSHKQSVRTLKRVGDVLTIVVVAGCCYEIYVRAVMREEARKQAEGSA